jgi:hypothetical protein
MRLRFPFPIVAIAGVVGLGAISIAGAQGPTLQPAANPEVSFTTTLSGANEVPGGTGDPDGTGLATITANTSTGQVCVNLTSTNIDAMTALHIHPGAAGVEAAPVVDFAVTSGTTASKCVASTALQVAAIVAAPANFYINAHTAAFTDGAIRGQLATRVLGTAEVRLLDEPTRAYDSRAVVADGKLVVGTPRAIDLSASVPTTARAALITLTVTQTVGGGYVTAYSNALTAVPATSTVNWTAPNSDVATTTTVAVDGSGKIALLAGQNATHVIVDVIGYYL